MAESKEDDEQESAGGGRGASGIVRASPLDGDDKRVSCRVKVDDTMKLGRI